MPTLSCKDVLASLRDAMDNENRRAQICIDLVGQGTPCRDYLLEIARDRSLDFYTRRFALRVVSGFRDGVVIQFIRTECLGNKSKAQLARERGTDQESHAQMALFVTGEEILNTPDFFERYVAKTKE